MPVRLPRLALGVCLLLASSAGSAAADPTALPVVATAKPDWAEILGPPKGTVPPSRTPTGSIVELPTHRQTTARTRIDWEPDIQKALEAAKRENRPVFVTFRCLPCKSCSEFDKAVLEGGADLDPMLLQFVTARLTTTHNVDMRLLPMAGFQDLDVSWWGWFLSPEGRTYAVFGGRDATGDQARTSKAALVATMKRVLAHHYDPRRPAWNVDGDLPVTEGKPQTPADLPGFKNWSTIRENGNILKQHNCIHCHQTSEIMRQGEIDLGRLDKKRDVQPWPFPENVGVVLDRDDGLKVTSVEPGSAAAKAGIQPGDALAAAGGRRLFSQADFRGVLHRAPLAAATVDVRWTRDGKAMAGTLDLADGWRRTDMSWRTSVAHGNLGAFPGFWPNDAGPLRDRLGIAADAMAVKPFVGKLDTPAVRAGLKATDVITAVNGESPNLAARNFALWFRMKFEPGDEVKLSVKGQDGTPREVKFKPER